MLNKKENKVKNIINKILQKHAPNKFQCIERKGRRNVAAERSEIDKPVDLHICLKGNNRALVCVEVADVNGTQMVGEAVRLFYDHCPRKMLIVGNDNTPANAVELSVKVLTLLYQQSEIGNTPCRVQKISDSAGIEQALKELLLI